LFDLFFSTHFLRRPWRYQNSVGANGVEVTQSRGWTTWSQNYVLTLMEGGQLFAVTISFSITQNLWPNLDSSITNQCWYRNDRGCVLVRLDFWIMSTFSFVSTKSLDLSHNNLISTAI
jgi:hypothetical protein